MAEGGRAEGVYEFGDFRLLAAQRRLIARSDGRPIELTQKALDALHFLLQHPGELLDKSTLMAAVWPNVVVEENNLNQVVSALRRALGDGSRGRRFIVTVPGRGYQFVAPVREVRDAAPSAPQPAPAAQATTSTRKSIAVLPFVNLTGDPAKDYLLPFRQDARFQALCRRMALFDFWEVNGPPDHCELSGGTLVCR